MQSNVRYLETTGDEAGRDINPEWLWFSSQCERRSNFRILQEGYTVMGMGGLNEVHRM